MRGSGAPALHGSDSGADLSECGGGGSVRDGDWERYWNIHGERLIWESWITKYGSYINPDYLPTVENSQSAADNAQEISFRGMFASAKNDGLPSHELGGNSFCPIDGMSLSPFHHCSLHRDEPDPPQGNDVDDCDSDSCWTRNDAARPSEGWCPLSPSSVDMTFGKTDEDEHLLTSGANSNGCESINGNTATTDSMTNVTRITMSSLDLSIGAEDLAMSSSSQSTTESSCGSEADQYWKELWKQHFNEQYYAHYNAFIAQQARSFSDGPESDEASTLVKTSRANFRFFRMQDSTSCGSTNPIESDSEGERDASQDYDQINSVAMSAFEDDAKDGTEFAAIFSETAKLESSIPQSDSSERVPRDDLSPKPQGRTRRQRPPTNSQTKHM